jgi:signal transduction histidine kinase
MQPTTNHKNLKNPKKITRLVHSIRFKIGLWYVAILTVVLLIFGIATYTVEANTLAGSIDAELGTGAEALSKTIPNPTSQMMLPAQITALIQQLNFLNLAEQNLGRLQDLPGIKELLNGQYLLLLINAKGQPTQHFGSLTPGDITNLQILAKAASTKTTGTFADYQPATTNNQDYRIYFYPILNNSTGESVGMLVLGFKWEGAATLRGLLLVLVLAGTGTLLITAGGGYWLASGAMRPVTKIIRTVQTIEETDLSQRLNIGGADEIGELAATFDSMLTRLENAFKRQRQFTADASHELRTPLTIVNLEIERVLGRQRSLEDYERALSIIQSENSYMTQLVNNLLMLARADNVCANLKLEKLDLSDLALEVVERFAPTARQNNIELSCGELPELEINGNHLYLTRMLANLLENGIKYTSGMGSKVEVATGFCTRTDDSVPSDVKNIAEYKQWAWLEVADNGPGIEPAHLPHLFERFYQVDSARSLKEQTGLEQHGSGLGLSIVRWVADQHQGYVQIESIVGQGTTFRVWFPLANQI